MAEIRINDDKTAVAVKRDLPDESPFLWSIAAQEENFFGPNAAVEGWTVL